MNVSIKDVGEPTAVELQFRDHPPFSHGIFSLSIVPKYFKGAVLISQ